MIVCNTSKNLGPLKRINHHTVTMDIYVLSIVMKNLGGDDEDDGENVSYDQQTNDPILFLVVLFDIVVNTFFPLSMALPHTEA